MYKQDVINALAQNDVIPVSKNDKNAVYAWLDGPVTGWVSSEWILAFDFDENDTLINFSVQQHLIGP